MVSEVIADPLAEAYWAMTEFRQRYWNQGLHPTASQMLQYAGLCLRLHELRQTPDMNQGPSLDSPVDPEEVQGPC